MNQIIKIFVLVMAFAAAGMTHAQGNIAVLDMQYAILNTDLAQKRLQQLREQRDYKENRKEFENLQKEYEKQVKKAKKDMAIMSNEQKQNVAKKLNDQRQDMEYVAKKMQAAEQEALQGVIQEIGPQMQKVVDQLIKDEKIGLLLDRKATLHVEGGFNVTSKVTARLNKALK